MLYFCLFSGRLKMMSSYKISVSKKWTVTACIALYSILFTAHRSLQLCTLEMCYAHYKE